MAVKFALLAALCVAQAFAFPSEDLGEDANRAIGNKDLRIVMGCFRLQEYNVMKMRDNIVKLADKIVSELDQDVRESAATHLKKTVVPVARIGVALLETHRTMYVNLNRLDVPRAHEALIAGVHKIEGIVTEIRNTLNEVKVEHPELTHAMNWYMRSLSFEMDVMVPKIRRDYGECLVRGRPSVLD